GPEVPGADLPVRPPAVEDLAIGTEREPPGPALAPEAADLLARGYLPYHDVTPPHHIMRALLGLKCDSREVPVVRGEAEGDEAARQPPEFLPRGDVAEVDVLVE